MGEMVRVGVGELVAHPENANRMNARMFRILKGHLERTGRCPPLIVRPAGAGTYQILDGHHRWRAARELGWEDVPCAVWDVDEDEARLALATLNRLRGSDDPLKRAALLAELLATRSAKELGKVLPETEGRVERKARLGSGVGGAEEGTKAPGREGAEGTVVGALGGPQPLEAITFFLSSEEKGRLVRRLKGYGRDRSRALVVMLGLEEDGDGG